MSEPMGATGPLAGLKVIDLTHVMAGPTCTLMLADMGADVIKVEKWPNGDDTRHSIPPKIGDEAASFLMMNRNKRGIVLDLKTGGGKQVLRRLIAGADVLVENFAPGAMERLGFGYEDHRRLEGHHPANPRAKRRAQLDMERPGNVTARVIVDRAHVDDGLAALLARTHIERRQRRQAWNTPQQGRAASVHCPHAVEIGRVARHARLESLRDRIWVWLRE